MCELHTVIDCTVFSPQTSEVFRESTFIHATSSAVYLSKVLLNLLIEAMQKIRVIPASM